METIFLLWKSRNWWIVINKNVNHNGNFYFHLNSIPILFWIILRVAHVGPVYLCGHIQLKPVADFALLLHVPPLKQGFVKHWLTNLFTKNKMFLFFILLIPHC